MEILRTDGRIRQGDCLTDYKSQGIKGASVRGIEDNGSASAMANKEAFHVKGTRHVDDLKIFVESTALFTENIMRTNAKMSALELAELVKTRSRPSLPPPPLPTKEHRMDLIEKAREWGKEFQRVVIAPLNSEQLARRTQQVVQRTLVQVREHWRDSLPVVSRQLVAERVLAAKQATRPAPAPGSVQERVQRKIKEMNELSERTPAPLSRDRSRGLSR